ncbi:MAG: nucleotide sugar dehydrogenase, partial [Lachnospirales bacterium]
DLVNQRVSPIEDKEISDFLKNEKLDLVATNDNKDLFKNCDYVIIATPTDYNVETNYFDTSSIEETLKIVIEQNREAVCIIKSTIPIGYVESIKSKLNFDNIIFSPEFLREGRALQDNLYPSRMIFGEKSERAENIANMYKECVKKESVTTLFMNSTEAESVKLFANTYLAMRVSYFNELDTFAEKMGLDTKSIIEGVSLDDRIGQHYNNPSFGYGGYCLPKDTKQLLANFKDIPNSLMEGICDSNDIRKKHIADRILENNPKIVGIFRLTMKKGSDNFRASAIQDVIKHIRNAGVRVVIFEPTLKVDVFEELEVVKSYEEFSTMSDVIVANRWDNLLENVKNKIYTRDIFMRD